jgi:hypothetical protein
MQRLVTVLLLMMARTHSFNIMDYTHYIEYLPYRVEGLAGFEDFRTAQNPRAAIRDRKMEVGTLQMQVEEVLADPLWPTRWPYSYEDFRPIDYARDEPIPTQYQYQYSQSLMEADHVIIVPGLVRVPIRRHFVMPKDKFAFAGTVQPVLLQLQQSARQTAYSIQHTAGPGWACLLA